MNASLPIKIFIDQGHNPTNPNAGAEGNGLREQDLTYEIGVRLAALLRADPRFDVRLSRNSPEESLGNSNASSLAARTTAANALGGGLFHQYSSERVGVPVGKRQRGFRLRPRRRVGGFRRKHFAGLTEATGFRDLGVFSRPSLYVLRRTAMPATLVEVGFITNPEEAFFIRDNTALIARGMYNGILRFFGEAI